MDNEDRGRPTDEDRERIRTQWLAFAYSAAYALLSCTSADQYGAVGESVLAQLSTRVAMGEVAALWIRVVNLPLTRTEAADDWAPVCAPLLDACAAWTEILDAEIEALRRGDPWRERPTAAERILSDRVGEAMNDAHKSARALYEWHGGEPGDLPDAASLMQVMQAQKIMSAPSWPDFRHPGM